MKSSDVHSEKAPCMVCQKEYNKGKERNYLISEKTLNFAVQNAEPILKQNLLNIQQVLLLAQSVTMMMPPQISP